MSNSIAPGSSADVNIKVTALTINPNVPAQYKTIILKKNLVNGVNTLTQEMMSVTNTKYVIKYNYVLDEDITIPENCILEFDGGKFSNGNIILSNTEIKGRYCFDNILFTGTCLNNEAIQDWFYNKNIDDFINFINSVKGVSVYVFSSGVFYPKQFVNKIVEKNTNITFIGNGCKMYYNDITEGVYYFMIQPKALVEEIIELNSPIYKGDFAIKVPDITKFKRGDYVIVRDYALSSFNYCRNYQQGEIIKVEQVDIDNSSIIPDHSIYGNYVHVSEAYDKNDELIEGQFVKLLKTSIINVHIENLEIKLVPDTNVSEYYTLGARIDNAFLYLNNFNVYNFGHDCVKLNACIDSHVENCHIQNTRDVGATGDTYGLTITGCQNILITSCALYGGRHGITIGGSYKGDTCTVSRYITVHACKVIGYRSGSGLNAHGAAEHLTVTECTTDEISLGCNNCKVVNCNATGIRSFDGITFNWVIENNTLTNYIMLQTRYIASAEYESTKRNYFINHDDELCIIKNNIITKGYIDILTNGDDEDNELVENMFNNLLNTKFIISDNVCGDKIQLRLIRHAYQNYPELVDYVKKSSIAIVKNNTFTLTGSSDSTSSIFCKTLIMDNNYINVPSAKNDYRIKVDTLLLRNNTFNYKGEVTNTAIIEYGSTNTLTIEDNIISENRPLLAAKKTYRTTQGYLVARRNKGYLSYTTTFNADDVEYNFDVLLEDNVSGRNERFDGCNVVYKSAYAENKTLSFKTLIGSVLRDSNGSSFIKFDNNKIISIPSAIKAASAKYSIGHGSYKDFKIHNENNITNYRTFSIIYRELRADGTGCGEHRIFVTNDLSYCITTINGFYRKGETYLPKIEYYYDLENNDYYLRIYETNGSYNTLIELEVVNNSPSLSSFEISQGTIDAAYNTMPCYNNGVVSPLDNIPTSGLTKRSMGELIMVNNKLSMFNGVSFVDPDGAAAGVIRNGNTNSRPSSNKVYIGFMYFDTTLGKPIYTKDIDSSTGVVTWVDATGTQV